MYERATTGNALGRASSSRRACGRPRAVAGIRRAFTAAVLRRATPARFAFGFVVRFAATLTFLAIVRLAGAFFATFFVIFFVVFFTAFFMLKSPVGSR